MNLDKALKEFDVFLQERRCSFVKDYIIKYDTYFKMGGNIKYFLTPLTTNELISIIDYLKNNKLEYKIIGFTSNVILLDEIEYSIIISTKNLRRVVIEDNKISVEAGYSLQDLVRIAIMNQVKGFEGLEGIPASIGGAVLMNAGAYGDTISDNLLTVTCVDKNNNLVVLNNKDCNFSHRNSIFKKNEYIILQATFKLIKGNRKEIATRVEKFHIARHSYQDFVYPNLGSMLSIKGSVYHQIFKQDSVFYVRYWFLKLVYKNPIIKFINRKKPNNKIFNKLLLKYLFSKKEIKLDYTLSTKSSNILINDGMLSVKDLIEYIFILHNLAGENHNLENEIILHPVYSVNKDFIEDYQYIADRLKQIQ